MGVSQGQETGGASASAGGSLQELDGSPYQPPIQYQQQQAYPPAQRHQQQQQEQQIPYAQAPPGAKHPAQYLQQPAIGIPQPGVASTVHAQPIPGMPLRGPGRAPAPGDLLLGYEVCQPETGCCQCNGLSSTGVVAIILLLFIFWPVAFIPCLMPECYEAYQRPVYGHQA
ncbi:hypothetical protein WJX74_010748 [Apatococcus lobatus]|uniref:Uncharacterized protein n=1 Tax=Apatococcus lobatus TaxID=904363 RepID=A0AAW1S754_9CHLO